LIERSAASFQGAFVINATKRPLKAHLWSAAACRRFVKAPLAIELRTKKRWQATALQTILSPDLNNRRVSELKAAIKLASV
jgi:hypothetical protein